MLETLLSAGIGALTVFLSMLIVSKKIDNMVENTKKQLKVEAEAWLNSEKGQKAIFTVGAIIGNGAKSGLGMNSRSGKFKWQDLAGQVITEFFTKGKGFNLQGNTKTPSEVERDLGIH